jgi:hypothetical protein
MTSPMRIASRAAHAIASPGVSSADGSRWRGFAGSSDAGRAGSIRSATRDPLGPEHEEQRERDVEEQVKQHDLARRIEFHAGDPALEMPDERHGEHAADQLEDEVAERHASRLGCRAQRRQHAEEAAAEVGAEHEAEGHRQGNHVQRRERCHEQHDSEAE